MVDLLKMSLGMLVGNLTGLLLIITIYETKWHTKKGKIKRISLIFIEVLIWAILMFLIGNL